MKNQIRFRPLTVFAVCAVAGLLLTSEATRGNSYVAPTHSYSLTEKDTIDKRASRAATTKVTAATSRPKAAPGCRKEGCSIFAEVDKSTQVMNVYVSGELRHTFPVSTGRPGHPTPDLDLRPQGPLYVKYRSTKYPEGDYQGLGNMPYAVFLKGGYAIHGTTPGSFKKLGTRASHGCIRLHPEDAKVFYELVKSIGLENTWVTVRS
jgi:lipoprotein-anchoring transpeptidase ErfK/SrfK